jgi:P-type E1-E2 ATPase
LILAVIVGRYLQTCRKTILIINRVIPLRRFFTNPAVSQVILHDGWGALVTMGTLVLNISLNIFQETRSGKQVESLAKKARTMATVIRDGRLKSIDQDELVVGDILVAGRGDEILADGVLVESIDLSIDESAAGEHERIVTKDPGDQLKTGAYCARGWAVYRVEQIHIEKLESENQVIVAAPAYSTTSLQKLFNAFYIYYWPSRVSFISVSCRR